MPYKELAKEVVLFLKPFKICKWSFLKLLLIVVFFPQNILQMGIFSCLEKDHIDFSNGT